MSSEDFVSVANRIPKTINYSLPITKNKGDIEEEVNDEENFICCIPKAEDSLSNLVVSEQNIIPENEIYHQLIEI